MAEPTTPATPVLSTRFHGRQFTRSRLSDTGLGRGNPLYHLLERNAFRDLVFFFDDFTRALDTGVWTASNNGAAAASFARSADVSGGIIQGDAGTDDNGSSRLFTTSNEVWRSGNRATCIFRARMPSTVANSKFEVGFADAAGDGAVLVKDTPTSTATDYAVIVRDTDDDTSVDLVTDGTTDAIQLVASSPGITFATNTFYTLMIALNEQKEAYFWIDSVFQGKAVRGPNTTTAQGLWAYVQDRDDANNKQLDIDYVAAWQERVAI